MGWTGYMDVLHGLDGSHGLHGRRCWKCQAHWGQIVEADAKPTPSLAHLLCTLARQPLVVQRAPRVVGHTGLAQAHVKGRLHDGAAVREVLCTDLDVLLVQCHGHVPCVHLTHPACTHRTSSKSSLWLDACAAGWSVWSRSHLELNGYFASAHRMESVTERSASAVL